MATIAENLQTILDIKNDIKDAIIAKGVSVADSDGFDTYASKIESITSGITSIDVFADGVKFYYSSNITEIPSYYDFSGNFTSMSNMFYHCDKLLSLPLINCEYVTGNANIQYCYDLQNIEGFTNLGKSWSGSSSHKIELRESTNLTKQACLNIFNSIYDMNLNSAMLESSYIYIYTTTYSKLSNDDIAIATSKDWTVRTS